jgi:hypothetical protein
MSRIKEYYWDFITDVDFNTAEDLDYQYRKYLESLNYEENLLYYNTNKNESIREDQISVMGSNSQ